MEEKKHRQSSHRSGNMYRVQYFADLLAAQSVVSAENANVALRI
jgi:hypothetical protein